GRHQIAHVGNGGYAFTGVSVLKVSDGCNGITIATADANHVGISLFGKLFTGLGKDGQISP
ncbi:hypothetical protein ACI62L_002196, partial [Neisseria gonorrhoeae]